MRRSTYARRCRAKSAFATGLSRDGSRNVPRDQRELRQRQLIDRLAEVDLGRGADAVGALTEEDHVEIQREDFLLRELVLDAERR